MSEVQSSRPPTRGRGASRGGRGAGGFGSSTRGGRVVGSSRQNGDSEYPRSSEVPIEEQGEMGILKSKYASQLVTLKEMFPTWTDEDLVSSLEETAGDLQQAATMISEGHATQWGEVKKKTKERNRSKPTGSADGAQFSNGRGGSATRGSRGAYEGSRGGRGRGTSDRGTTRGGRGGFTGSRTRSTANGSSSKDATATTEDWADSTNASAPTWEPTTDETQDEKPRDEAEWDAPATGGTGWDAEPKPAATVPAISDRVDQDASLSEAAKDVTPAAPMSASEKPASKSSAKTWASMLRGAANPTTVAKQTVTPQTRAEQPNQTPSGPSTQVSAPAPATLPTISPIPAIEEIAPTPPIHQGNEIDSLPPPPAQIPTSKSPVVTPALPDLIPPKITEPTAVSPPPSAEKAIIDRPPTPPDITNTAAVQPPPALDVDELTEDNLEKIEDVAPPRPTSTAAGTVNSMVPASTPRGFLHRAPGSRSGLRKILDQQEAVVMPRDHSIDRATVQFGSMGLNGDADEPDEPESQEQPENIGQALQQSPIGQPKSSTISSGTIGPQVPSAIGASGHSPFASAQTMHEPLPAPRNAPGLGPPSQQNIPPAVSQTPTAPQNIQQSQQSNQSYQSQSLPNQTKFGSQEHSKFEPFGQQLSQHQTSQSPYGYPSHSQNHQSQYHQSAQPSGVGSSGMQSDLSAFYHSEQGRGIYQGYYNTPPQSQHQHGQVQQDQGLNQQRSSSGLGQVGTSGNESQTSGSNAPGQPNLSRFGSGAQGVDSGHVSPSPALSNAHQAAQQHPHNPYPMHPSYYPYYNYMNMYGGYPGFQNGGKGFYGQPQQGFMSPGYEHASSPAGFGGFGGPSSQGRESSLSEYSRATSGQTHTQQPQHSSGGFNSSMPDYMSSRNIGSQQQQMSGLSGSNQGQQIGHSEDTLKPFGETKTPSGPSNLPSSAPGRPPSTSGMSSQQLGHSQGPNQGQPSQQQPPMGGSGGYPHHLQNQNVNGGMGQGSHQSSGYNMYGGFGGYPSQYGNQGSNRQTSSGGGWGYGH